MVDVIMHRLPGMRCEKMEMRLREEEEGRGEAKMSAMKRE
jgi:hypothetical protein